jgi:hypothetical protein
MLHHLTISDAAEQDAQVLLQRLQRIAGAMSAGSAKEVGISRPLARPHGGRSGGGGGAAEQQQLQQWAEGGGGEEHPVDQHARCRKIMDSTLLLLDRLEASSLEHKLNHKQLLEAVVTARSYLVSPRSLARDHKSHNSLPPHICSPQAIKFTPLGTFVGTAAAVAAAASTAGPTPLQPQKLDVIADLGAWLLCKDPVCLRGQKHFVHKATNNVQVGEPFDVRMKKNRANLLQEHW